MNGRVNSHGCQYDDERKLAFCHLCTKHKPELKSQRIGFVIGSPNLKIYALKRHKNESSDHSDAVRIEKSKIQKQQDASKLPAYQMLERLRSSGQIPQTKTTSDFETK